MAREGADHHGRLVPIDRDVAAKEILHILAFRRLAFLLRRHAVVVAFVAVGDFRDLEEFEIAREGRLGDDMTAVLEQSKQEVLRIDSLLAKYVLDQPEAIPAFVHSGSMCAAS